MNNTTYPGFSNLLPVTDADRLKYPPKYPDGFDRKVFNPKTGLGLLFRSQFEVEKRENFFYNGIEVEFEDFWPTDIKGEKANIVRAFYTKKNGANFTVVTLWIPINKIDLESLKKLELWTILPEDLKKSLEDTHVVQVQESIQVVNDLMETARNGRKRNPEHANLPREIVCCTVNCGNKIPYISPTMLIERAKEKQCTIEEYAKTWKCSECEPRRKGRQVSAKWAGLPKELTCSCGKVQKQHPGITEKQAEVNGIVFSEYVKTWKCKDCRKSDPTTTTSTTTRGRKENPNTSWFGKAKELKCACGKVQPQHGSITDSQAKKLGKTYEEYVLSWQCMNCRPQGMKRVRIGNSNLSKVSSEALLVPKETTCTGCKKPVKLVPSNIIDKAKILGVTIEYLVSHYLCRSCGGRLPKGSKALLELTK